MIEFTTLLDANTLFTVEVMQVAQPTVAELSAKQIWVGVDNDSDLTNGLIAAATVTEVTPSATLPTIITVNSVEVSNLQIRRVHQLTILVSVPSSTFVAIKNFFLEVPLIYSKNMIRGDYLTCSVTRTDNAAAELIADQKCQIFSSNKVLFNVISDSGNTSPKQYKFILYNLQAPAYVEEPYLNNFRFNCFITNTDYLVVTHLCADYSVPQLSFSKDANANDLVWNFYT